MKSQANHLKTIGAAALAVLAVAVIAITALAYGAATSPKASAEIDTMTSQLSPQDQQAIDELSQDIAASQQAQQQAEAQAANAAIDADQPADGASPGSQAASSDAQAAGPVPAPGLTAPDNCTVTINYMENVKEDDPDTEVDETGRALIGTRTLTGLQEGTQLNAWDYIVNIPGFFFFDGWPREMTVTTDPAQNVFTFTYFRLWDSEFTVNYYLMVNANLTADNWTDALAPNDVEFIKMGSETFTDQPFDELVKGDAYEYMLNGMYVIDTYPAEIRLGTDPDNNVINVLYTPDSANLPDDMEVPNDVAGNPDGTPPEHIPSDTTVNYDGLISNLPDDVLIDERFEDFVGSDIDRGEMDVTDEMLANPVSKEDAERMIDAYNTGLRYGTLSQTGDNTMAWVWVLAGVAAAAVVAIVVVAVVRRKKANDKA